MTDNTIKPMEVVVRIEISKNTKVKYEIDQRTHELHVDRILHGNEQYFFNYGYIENTYAGDKDPLDAVVFCDEPFYPKSLVKCKVLGYLKTIDEKGHDEKLITVPIDKIDPFSVHIKSIDDIKCNVEKLKLFFKHYKIAEDKYCQVEEEPYGHIAAITLINESLKRCIVLNKFAYHCKNRKYKKINKKKQIKQIKQINRKKIHKTIKKKDMIEMNNIQV